MEKMEKAKYYQEFTLTKEGYDNAPEYMKEQIQIGQPIRGFRKRVPRSWVENGYVELENWDRQSEFYRRREKINENRRRCARYASEIENLQELDRPTTNKKSNWISRFKRDHDMEL